MKNNIFKLAILFLFIASSVKALGQSDTKYPASFTITKSEYNSLFSYKVNKKVRLRKNKYLNGAVVIMNQKVVDNKQLRLKLKQLENAELVIQVNGTDSTIIFILIEGSNVSYKTEITDKEIKFIKGTKDEIITE